MEWELKRNAGSRRGSMFTAFVFFKIGSTDGNGSIEEVEFSGARGSNLRIGFTQQDNRYSLSATG